MLTLHACSSSQVRVNPTLGVWGARAEGEDDVAKQQSDTIASHYRTQVSKGYGLCRLLRSSGRAFLNDFSFKFGMSQHDAGVTLLVATRRTQNKLEGLGNMVYTGCADTMMQPSPANAERATPPKMDTNCTALSLIPTVTGNTARSFYYARTTVRSQGGSTTVSRSDTIQLT